MATVAEKKAFIVGLLNSNDRAVGRALVAILARQTADEQAAGVTVHHNARGFSGADAEFCTSLAKGFQRYGRLTPKQLAIARPKMLRYWKQLIEVSEANGKAPWQKVEAFDVEAAEVSHELAAMTEEKALELELEAAQLAQYVKP